MIPQVLIQLCTHFFFLQRSLAHLLSGLDSIYQLLVPPLQVRMLLEFLGVLRYTPRSEQERRLDDAFRGAKSKEDLRVRAVLGT